MTPRLVPPRIVLMAHWIRMAPRVRPVLIVLMVLTLIGCASGGNEPAGGSRAADLILTGGRVVTVDVRHPEAEALAVREGRILAVGSTADIEHFAGPSTRVIDLDGHLALPGFYEGHGHFTGIGRSRMNVDLTQEQNYDAVVTRIAEAAADTPPGQWVLGWGWHQDKWERPPRPAVEGYPVHEALSRATPDHPVLLKHAAGAHAGLANARALERAGIDRDTPDPPGGTILRDALGNATGVLRENAYQLVLRAYEADMAQRDAQTIEADLEREIELADAECLRYGVTSIADAGSSFDTLDRLRRMAETGRLRTRVWAMIREDNDLLERRIADYAWNGVADHRLTVRAIKRSLDGALGSHGAWLLAPYDDLPGSTGLNTLPLDELARTADIAARHGFQLCVHAIGDRANRETLDLFARTFEAYPEREDWRWRIEHAQHLDPADIPRFAELDVIASMQTVHCTSDGPWVPTRLGEQRSAAGAYVWRELLDSGATVINGTDAPIESIDPIANFHAAVTRRMRDGRTFHADQRMTREEALRSATLDAAYAAFQDDLLGSLSPGKLADIVVLSRDISSVPEEQILDAEVLYTIVGGEVEFGDGSAF